MKKKPAYNDGYTFLPSEEMGNNHMETMHKTDVSQIIFTLLLLYNAKFNVSKNWTFTLNICLPDYIR